MLSNIFKEDLYSSISEAITSLTDAAISSEFTKFLNLSKNLCLFLASWSRHFCQ